MRPEYERYETDWLSGRTLKLPYLFTDSGNDIAYWKNSSALSGRQGRRTLYFVDDVVVQPVSTDNGVNPSNLFSSEYVETGEFGSRAWISSQAYVQCDVTPAGSE